MGPVLLVTCMEQPNPRIIRIVLRNNKGEEWGDFPFILSFTIKLWSLKQCSIVNIINEIDNERENQTSEAAPSVLGNSVFDIGGVANH